MQLPALRARSDFQALTERLLAEINPRRDVHLASDLLARPHCYAWAGNLRQFANALRTASAMLDPHESCIDWQHLPDDLMYDLSSVLARARSETPPPALPITAVAQDLTQLAQATIRRVLEQSDGNTSQADRHLGNSRQTLYRKVKLIRANAQA